MENECTNIVKLTEESTAEEEIEFLRGVADSIPDGSWLSWLFTKNLIGWVIAQVAAEHVPNLFSIYDSARAELADRDGVIADLRDRLRADQEQTANEAAEEWQDKCNATAKEWSACDKKLDDLQKHLSDLAIVAWLGKRTIDPDEIRDILASD